MRPDLQCIGPTGTRSLTCSKCNDTGTPSHAKRAASTDNILPVEHSDRFPWAHWPMSLPYIDGDTVHRICGYPELVDALARYHHEPIDAMEDLMILQPSLDGGEDQFFMRAAWQRDSILGVKVITGFPANPDRREPLSATQAVYLLFDGSDGRALVAIDGTALTYRKTAADSALGSRLLCPPEPRHLLMVGAGGLAPYLIGAHIAMRPSIERVSIRNRTIERARRMAAGLDLDEVRIEVVEALEPAVRAADLISCATNASRPLICGEWLKPGAHLDMVGAYRPDMREADDDTVRRATLFVDARASTLGVVGDLVMPIADRIISESDVVADLYDLLSGKHPGRRGEEEITLFKNGGGGHLDLMTARFVFEHAR